MLVFARLCSSLLVSAPSEHIFAFFVLFVLISALFKHIRAYFVLFVLVFILFEHTLAFFVLFVLVSVRFKHKFTVSVLSKHVRNSAKALVELRFITDTSVIKAIDRKSNLWTKFTTAKCGDCTASVVSNLLIINKMIEISTHKNGGT